jgi:hypothetical protein
MFAVLGRVAAGIGTGLVAGAIGTAVMTAVQRMEMMLTDSEPSTTPADTVEEVIGLEPRSDGSKALLGQLAHWGYGTGLGAGRGVLAALGVPARVAEPLFLASVWGAPMVYLPKLEVAPPVTEWSPGAIAKDFAHHLVYAATVAVVHARLTRGRGLRPVR